MFLRYPDLRLVPSPLLPLNRSLLLLSVNPVVMPWKNHQVWTSVFRKRTRRMQPHLRGTEWHSRFFKCFGSFLISLFFILSCVLSFFHIFLIHFFLFMAYVLSFFFVSFLYLFTCQLNFLNFQLQRERIFQIRNIQHAERSCENRSKATRHRGA